MAKKSKNHSARRAASSSSAAGRDDRTPWLRLTAFAVLTVHSAFSGYLAWDDARLVAGRRRLPPDAGAAVLWRPAWAPEERLAGSYSQSQQVGLIISEHDQVPWDLFFLVLISCLILSRFGGVVAVFVYRAVCVDEHGCSCSFVCYMPQDTYSCISNWAASTGCRVQVVHLH